VTATALRSRRSRATTASRHSRPGWSERRQRAVARCRSRTGKWDPCNRVPLHPSAVRSSWCAPGCSGFARRLLPPRAPLVGTSRTLRSGDWPLLYRFPFVGLLPAAPLPVAPAAVASGVVRFCAASCPWPLSPSRPWWALRDTIRTAVLQSIGRCFPWPCDVQRDGLPLQGRRELFR